MEIFCRRTLAPLSKICRCRHPTPPRPVEVKLAECERFWRTMHLTSSAVQNTIACVHGAKLCGLFHFSSRSCADSGVRPVRFVGACSAPVSQHRVQQHLFTNSSIVLGTLR